MKTVIFYSPRGGTGRSLCLANCAVSLSQAGCKVLVLDMDIEAGGLDIIFKGSRAITPQVSSPPKGLAKCLITQEMKGLKDAIEDLKALDFYKSVGAGGDLHLIPIYICPDLMDQIQRKWSRSEEFAITLRQLKETIVGDYDYDFMLVDLPTGFNPIRENFIKMSDLAVVLSRPNMQGAYGAKLNLDEFAEFGLKTIFALSCVPSPAKPKTKKSINEFKKYAGIVDIDVIIPLDNVMAFFEDIPVITRPATDVAKAYKKIAEKIREV